MRGLHSSLGVFAELPWSERLFVHARLFSAPLEAVAKEVRGPRILDVGCGHGVLVALLAVGFPERAIVGLDPDLRKIDWARRSVGRLPNVELAGGTLQLMVEQRPTPFDSIVVADVLYLLPPDSWSDFLTACRALLRPGGRLVVKEAEDDGSWRVSKALLQERLMVHVLGRTQGNSVGFQPRETLLRALTSAKFSVREIRSLARGYTTPHVLLVAECA